MDAEKLELITQLDYKSHGFKNFLKNEFKSTKRRGNYLIGISACQMQYLLEKFSQIAQTSSIKMFNQVNKLL